MPIIPDSVWDYKYAKSPSAHLTHYTLSGTFPRVNEVQQRLANLQGKGWTLAAIADELGVTVNAVEKWKAGQRQPSNAKGVYRILDHLMERKQAPKQRRYNKRVISDE